MKNLTPELIAKAKAAKSAEELFELAKANGIEMTDEEANTYFEQLSAKGVMSDDELDLIAGGGSCPGDEDPYLTCIDLPEGTQVELINGEKCARCGSTRGVSELMNWCAANAGTHYVGLKCRDCKENIVARVRGSEITRL